MRRLLRQELQNALEDGYTRFISGMARGFDIWAAEEVVRLRGEHPQLRLVCAVPYPGFEKGWKKEWRNRFDQLLDQADETVFVNRSRLHGGVYQLRNRWMVEQSQRVIALYAGGPRRHLEHRAPVPQGRRGAAPAAPARPSLAARAPHFLGERA